MENYIVLAVFLLYPSLPVSSGKDTSFVFDLKDAPALYKDFAKRYQRKFKSEFDYNQRYINFVQTLRYINGINSQADTLQKVLPNQYADFSDDERREFLRENHKHIDPELRDILRMDDEYVYFFHEIFY